MTRKPDISATDDDDDDDDDSNQRVETGQHVGDTDDGDADNRDILILSCVGGAVLLMIAVIVSTVLIKRRLR